jgi:hypothetical protein
LIHPEPGTNKFSCARCGKNPLDTRVYRAISGKWYCAECLPTSMINGWIDLQPGQPQPEGPTAPQRSQPLDPNGPEVLCPASMCPLFAKDGSLNAGIYAGTCPEKDDIDNGGCPWWSVGCSTGFQHRLVDRAAANRRKPAPPRTFDCPHADVCSWQKQASKQGKLCAPRAALAAGVNARVVDWNTYRP